jgi:DNA-binding MarR family transcriptional regulator
MPKSLSALAGLVGSLTRANHSGRALLARHFGMEPGAHYLLGRLNQQGDLRTSELAAQACVDASVVSRQVQSLLAHGYVERVADQTDGRAFKLHLTASGAQLLTQNEEIQSQFFERVLQDWSKSDQELLEQLLTRLVADFNREIQHLNQNPEVRAVNE